MGAAVDRIDRQPRWCNNALFISEVVNGKFNNVYTSKDLVLKILFSLSEWKKATGLCAIFTEQYIGQEG